MKIFSFFLSLFFCVGAVADIALLSPSLIELLSLMEIHHDGTLKSIVETTQKAWIQTGKERWQFEEKEKEKWNAAFPLLKKIGCVDKVEASQKRYDYCLVLGGLSQRMQKRFDLLIEEWEKGVRFDRLIFLTGERNLDPQVEDLAVLLQTEAQAMEYLFQKANVSEDLRQIPLQIISASAGGKRRATTADTVAEWLKTNPSPGLCLVLSNQPFVDYQNAVLKTFLPKTFQIETIGKEADPDTFFAVYLDNLARFLYQEKIRLSNEP